MPCCTRQVSGRPYVFVGRSLAGLDGVLFADGYRNELAGLLLVDAAFPKQGELMAQVAGFGALMKQTRSDFGPYEAAARAHRLPRSPPLVDLCLNHDRSYTPSLISNLDGMALRPTYWSDLIRGIM